MKQNLPRPGVCLVLSGPDLETCQRQLDESRPWIDLAEVRADKLDRSEWPALNAFATTAGVPLILTLRQPRDGGSWEGPPEEREAFFLRALDAPWSWVDLEDDQRLPAFEARWRALGRELIVSFHEFEEISTDWTRRVRAAEGPGVIAKAAVMPKSSADYLRFVRDVLALPPGDRVLLAMGGLGFTSRVLAARLGSRWTYTSPPGQTVAPGQTDPQTLVELYRFRDQTATTAVYGIVGNPVFHSKSPAIHNGGLARAGRQGTYLPFLADDPAALLATADLLGVRGLSCTIPFKEQVLPLLHHRSEAVEAIGACNTLLRTEQGWVGDNTDAPGFLEPLAELRGGGGQGVGATVVGTGGAARAVIWALRKDGYRVLVLGRDASKASLLAAEFGCSWAQLSSESLPEVRRHSTVIAQTTNVGMGELAGQDPMAWYEFDGTEMVYEIIYAPAQTALVLRAQRAGCTILWGRQMLEHQAWRQFRAFTGADYPRLDS